MKTRNLATTWLALLAIVAPTTLPAAQHTLVFDPEESELTFVLDATMHDVEGKLFLSSGEIRFDDETGEVSGELVVDATRTDTDNKKRDKKMHGSVLESERFPWIVFHPLRLKGDLAATGHSEIAIEGTMSIHGADHPVEMPVVVDIDGEGARVASEFSIPYVEWGMKDPSVFILRVAKQVEVTFRAEGRFEEEPGEVPEPVEPVEPDDSAGH